MLVGSLHFHLECSGQVPVRLHCRGVVAVGGVLWTRKGRGHADIPSIFDTLCDLVLALHGCS